MDDWTKEPYVDRSYLYHRNRCLAVKKTKDFIASFPDGATAKDFEAAGLPPTGIERLVKLKVIVGTQIREPERGPRCYHWLWKLNTKEDEGEECTA